jgi:hypothetical protein
MIPFVHNKNSQVGAEDAGAASANPQYGDWLCWGKVKGLRNGSSGLIQHSLCTALYILVYRYIKPKANRTKRYKQQHRKSSEHLCPQVLLHQLKRFHRL